MTDPKSVQQKQNKNANMIPNETLQTIETAGLGVKRIGSFKITDATQARILMSLSDKMYTRKQLAVVREYSNNAADAHIVAEKPVSEVIVTLPTLNNLTFKVRDFGSGLSMEQIRDVYCIMGESSKRNSPKENGVLGYGCKAGFAEADSFTVTSWNNGEKAVYNCIKGDSTHLHDAFELSRCPSNEPSGIEVCIPVKQTNLWTFHSEAADFFKYWETLPTINDLEESHKEAMMKFRNTPPTLKGDGWCIRPRSNGTAEGAAFMGGVAYNINWKVLYERMALTSQKRVMFDILQNNDVTLFFNMGEVQFVDSRESLEYTEMTLNALTSRIESIFTKIKESIQEKFDPAPTIWDAKIIYNALFGTGILELEKGEEKDCIERIKILDGNLIALESSMSGTFKWKGVDLSDSGFYDINKFDNSTPDVVHDDSHDPIAPVMVTYRRKKKRAKINRCSDEKNNNIVASHQVAVVVNDLGSKSGQSVVARYLIFRPDSKIRTVHLLTFANSTIKDNFYKINHFDTVPTIKMSSLIGEARVWNNANKVTRTYGGGGGGVRVMEYMDITNGTVEENDVPIREMEEGGLYIKAAEGRRGGRRVMMQNGYSEEYPNQITSLLKKLGEKTGIDIDRVYIINKQTSESKWFKQAIESGDWTNVWDYVKENLDIDIQPLVTAEAYNNVSTVCKEAAELLVPKIMDKNSLMLKLINTVGDKSYDEHVELVNTLQNLYLWQDLSKGIKSTINFEEVSKATQAMYPLLSFGHLDSDYYATEEKMSEIAKYVNMADVYAKLERTNLLSAVFDETDCSVEIGTPEKVLETA